MPAPCDNCPFRNDRPGYLHPETAEEIAGSLESGKSFKCHKTLAYDDDGEPYETASSLHCAGAIVMLERMEMPNQMMRIAARLGTYKPGSICGDVIVEDSEEFIEHNSQGY